MSLGCLENIRELEVTRCKVLGQVSTVRVPFKCVATAYFSTLIVFPSFSFAFFWMFFHLKLRRFHHHFRILQNTDGLTAVRRLQKLHGRALLKKKLHLLPLIRGADAVQRTQKAGVRPFPGRPFNVAAG